MNGMKQMAEIVGLTQGTDVPSTRFRWTQYFDDFEKGGLKVFELQSRFGAYPPVGNLRRSVWLGAAIADGLSRTIKSNRYSLRFLQRNLISTLCTWEPLMRKPYVLDVDDAIFLGPRGSNADRIARSASLVICGNAYLADHFSAINSIVVVPTAVDTQRYKPILPSLKKQQQVIGWSGSSSGLKYLYSIESALILLFLKYPELIIKVICDKPPEFKKLPTNRVVFEKWTIAREILSLNEFSIGIMPLEDDLWCRGKCSFKMLTYMAIGIPVVVSPVGMNAEILAQAECGFGARNIDEWVDAISCLIADTTLAVSMGLKGRSLVESCYSKNIIGPNLTKILKSQL